MPDETEFVEILARRHPLLRELRERPRKRHELVDDVDEAKSTVYKGVSQLLELGLVERTDDGLHPTLLGSVAHRRYEELRRTADLGTHLERLSPTAIDPVVFVGSDLIRPEPDTVGRHLEYAQTLLETADEVRGVVPAVATENIDVVRERVRGGELTAEFVLSAELADAVLRERADEIERYVDDVVLWRSETAPPIGLFVVRDGETKTMGIEFRDGNLVTGLLANDTAESVAWADREVDRYRAAADRLPPLE